MELTVAMGLIEKGVEQHATPQRWADLGAGTGLFSQAIAQLVSNGSLIYAIDKRLPKTIRSIGHATIAPLEKDFITDELHLANLDGIIMANSLHFVQDKLSLLVRLKTFLKEDGRLILVEYDKLKANPWVPYPIDFDALKDLAHQTGFGGVQGIGEHPSQYHEATIYAALIQMGT